MKSRRRIACWKWVGGNFARSLPDVRFGSKADIEVECALAGGQFSCGDFDSVPGVVILELCWA
jgi:hypothetical protein